MTCFGISILFVETQDQMYRLKLKRENARNVPLPRWTHCRMIDSPTFLSQAAGWSSSDGVAPALYTFHSNHLVCSHPLSPPPSTLPSTSASTPRSHCFSFQVASSSTRHPPSLPFWIFHLGLLVSRLSCLQADDWSDQRQVHIDHLLAQILTLPPLLPHCWLFFTPIMKNTYSSFVREIHQALIETDRKCRPSIWRRPQHLLPIEASSL